MESRFKDRVVLITGGNSGIGFATAKRLVTEGARVIVTGRNRDKLEQATRELGTSATGIVADVAKLEDIDQTYSQIKTDFGRLDGLFANAGVAGMHPIASVTEAIFDELMDINVKGTYFTIQKAIPLLSRGSSVVVNASVADTKGSPVFSVYGATKAAVRSMARTFSGALIERGIRVNAVSPGPIETPIWSPMADAAKLQKLAELNPSKRFGTAEEIASAVAFLLAPESAYVVGAELYVDGGATQL